MELRPNCSEFCDARLAALYDRVNPYGRESAFCSSQAGRLAANASIDLGCGTGLLTCELAKRGHAMTGIEPSPAMLAVARAKPYADQIKWLQGSFEQMEGLKADMVLMTSHVAQFFLDDDEWRAMLAA